MRIKTKLSCLRKNKCGNIWDEEGEKWWFSIVDIVAVLTDSDYQTARKYWKVLKGRLAKEGNESVTNCYQLKMQSTDGKFYLTDVADTEQKSRALQALACQSRHANGIDAFIQAEVLPYAPDAWVDESKTPIGYEISFTISTSPYSFVSFRKIIADIRALEAEIEGLLEKILGN